MKIILPAILVLVSFSHLPARNMENDIENFPAGTWREERVAGAKGGISYTVDTAGRIVQVFVPSHGQIVGGEINFRKDEFAGPSLWLNDVPLPSAPLLKGTVKGSMGKNDTLSYQIVYRTEGKRLAIDITCSNLLKQKLEDVQLSCRLGIDTEMERFPHWRSVFFPTLMRCEQSSFWGYLMTPMGRILTVTCPHPIASYHLHYNNSRHKISFSNGHRIRTVSLDLLNPDPLPQRHPQGGVLAAGETRTWTIYLEEAATLSDVAAIASQNTTAPIFQADYYTLASGEKALVSLYSSSVPHVAVVTPEGERRKVRVRKSRKNLYTFTYPMSSVGIHTFTATNSKGKSAEMKLACRHSRYSDYIKAARLASLTYQQKTNSNAESWYGLFSGLIARTYFPDKEVDDKVDKVFHQINKLTLVPGIHLPANNPMRIQDSALKAALFAQYYRATGVLEYLRQAADIADFVMTTQLTYEWDAMLDNTEFTGAYHSEKTHYTSVIYIAKGIMEVMREEKKLIESDKTGEWQHRYDRHYASVKMAMDDLAERLDNIQTEGQMTFEDGMISCSYTQLAEFALLHSPDSPERAYYTQAAEQLANMHRCLSQIVVPDARMNGGSLRFWESQYDILTMPNMMSSPHGWSAWRIYGLRSLYLLTGNYDYLRQMVNAIGACIQLIDPDTGKLNWAFVCDPYIVAQRFIPDEAKPHKGKHVEQVLGEQYLPMISDWYRADTNRFVSSFGRFDGGCCDNDVHEIFKCLGEVILTSAYVYEHPDGTLTAHHCSVSREGEVYRILPGEGCVRSVHLNLRSPRTVVVKFPDKEVKQEIQSGWMVADMGDKGSFGKEVRSISVIPIPMEYELQKGYFPIDSLTLFSDVSSSEVKCLIDEKLTELGGEGYVLEITSGGILLKAASEAGLFYGKMTLRQLYADNKVPCVRIKDKPRFSHRGIMVDVSRHFFSKEEIKEIINWMSVYKLNRFHWHLTDDGGWRFEVEDYPELTNKTAFRSHHLWREWWKNGGKFVSAGEQGAAGGYYTKEDIKEIVEYAANRYITIIPEIEFPGHSREVFVAYPELCCTEKPYSGGTFCVGNDKTYAFMKSVLNAVMDMFPSEMVHIGGDETNTAAWKNCPKCRGLMSKENMKDIHELHNYIIGEAEKILKCRGRRMIGWDEIANEKRDKSSVIMSWRGEQAGIDAAQKGYDVILTPLHYLYLDYFQASPDKEPLAHDGYTPIEKVYAYKPIPDALNAEAHAHILGIQGNIWTEWIPDMKHLEYMAFPRTLAVAEVAWSPEEKRSWKSFRERLGSHIAKLRDAGVNTYKLSSDIESVVNVDTVQKKLEVSLKCERNDVEIRYTDNGLRPTRKSALYSRPLVVKDSLCVKAAAFKKGDIQGDIFTQHFYYHKGIGKKVQFSARNRSGQIFSDGCTGGKTYLDGSWVNFSGDQELIMDLGEDQEVHTVSTRWMQLRAGARRHLPQQVEIFFSGDGKNYISGGIVRKKSLKDIPALQYQEYIFNGQWNARYIKMKIKAGDGGMSVDEIIVL